MASGGVKMQTQNRIAVLVDGAPIEASAIRHDPGAYQNELLAAKQKFGSAICRCQNTPLKLVIRELNHKLFLACWPDQAQSHALSCPFYSATEDNGRAKYASDAITTDGITTGIKLHHAVVQKSAGTRPEGSATGFGRVHLWGLLHHLWESAGLNRWHPGWERDWGFGRYSIRRAAQSTMVDGHPLIHSLYLPPIWNSRKKDATQAHWNEFVEPLQRLNRSRPEVASGFVMGIVRKLEPSERGYVLYLQHHATAFHIDKNVVDFLVTHSRRGWFSLTRSQDTSSPLERVLAFLRIQSSANGFMVVVEAALMRVSKNYIPVSNQFEERLADLLVADDRRFIRPLHYDAHQYNLPHFILMDCAPGATSDNSPAKVCLFVSPTANTPFISNKTSSVNRGIADRLGYGYWQWNAFENQSIPLLPAVFSNKPKDLNHV